MTMDLPEYVLRCMHTLHSHGFAAYAVGGCVRDAALGIVPHDYDLCTDALPEQTQALFSAYSLITAGKKHGTIGVITPEDVVEITTFRREGSYGDNRRPDWVAFVPELREDLARRDFTVNAMAYAPEEGLVDPFGGMEDLSRGILRTVGDADTRFQEDSLRILRGIRFCATYGLSPEPSTEAAMHRQKALMDNLARERVFEELNRTLPRITANQLVRFAPLLAQVIPALAPEIHFDQHSPYHAYDLFTHTAHVTQSVPTEQVLRWTALLHDIGKVPTFSRDETGRGHFYQHAQVGADMADETLRALKAPTALREEVVWLIAHHMSPLLPEKKTLRRQLSRWGEARLKSLLALQEADMTSKGTGKPQNTDTYAQVRSILDEILTEDSCLRLKDLAVNGDDLMALGLRGKAVGDTLNDLLEQVLDETLPNVRDALLRAAQARKTEQT